MTATETIFSVSLEETNDIAFKLSKEAKKGDVFVLQGDLGAGKTCFTKFLLKALGYTGIVNSPTFTILNTYRLPNGLEVNHFDLYRIGNTQEFEMMGLDEFITEKNINVLEWGDRINLDILSCSRIIKISISKLSENSRMLFVERRLI